MAIAKVDGVTTDAPEVSVAPVPTKETPPKKELSPFEVELNDGTVVRLRKTTAYDDTIVDGIVYDWQANALGQVPPTISLRAQALNAVTHIDGKEQGLLEMVGRSQLISLMRRFSSDDMDIIGDKYYEIQGKKKKMIEAIEEAQKALRQGNTFQS